MSDEGAEESERVKGLRALCEEINDAQRKAEANLRAALIEEAEFQPGDPVWIDTGWRDPNLVPGFIASVEVVYRQVEYHTAKVTKAGGASKQTSRTGKRSISHRAAGVFNQEEKT